MSGAIYHLGRDNRLIEMRQEGYVTEEHLQELLASYPALLAGEHRCPAAVAVHQA